MPSVTPEISEAAFDLAPAEAIAYMEGKGFVTTWDWKEQLVINSAQVFTVAKAMSMDVLQDIRSEVEAALKNGTTFKDFQKNLEPRLRAKGWWGKGVDPVSGKTVQLGSPHRLETIYQTNTQSAYQAGHWKRQEENKVNRPYLEYDAVGDAATRPSHLELSGVVKPVDDPFWSTYYPPNGYNCRCRVISLTPEQTNKKGGVTEGDPEVDPDNGFSQNSGKTPWQPKKADYDADIWRAGQPIAL